MRSQPRRVFLETVSVVSLAVCGRALGGCSGTSRGHAATGPVAGGNVKDVPVGTLRFVPGEPVILGRDAGGLYAMTAICTHDQCDMSSDGSIAGTTIGCDCHGSHFDANGNVRTGPARAALVHYKVELAADGAITVQAGQTVPASTRTPVTT